ncbi:unnamed protein product [Periconia digitata]|uniref:RING-type domain-containing protein n=1 Tax=Periconia digitata TaxID=1303443 RepID=A0A9W4UML3_9PLEO|nr:unnamed protein product [Periconia digitata]
MASSDTKSAPLADELREYAESLDPSVYPKGNNFKCNKCSNLLIDGWKLDCCNRLICGPCHDELEFPTTCPVCDHSPLEETACVIHKATRSTIRVWLSKLKAKEARKAAEEAAAAAAATPTSEAAPGPSEQSLDQLDKQTPDHTAVGDGNKVVESIEEAQATDSASTAMSTSVVAESEKSQQQPPVAPVGEESNAPGIDSQPEGQSGEPTASDADVNGDSAQDMPDQGDAALNNQMMDQNGMAGQFGNFGFGQNAAGFNNNGMGFNGMNPMNPMSNMMGNGAWNMNTMGFGMNGMNGMNGMPGMYNGFGGNMGMGMNDMSSMNYGGGYGNGWNGMGGAGYGGGYNSMAGGYNQSGTYPGMMNHFAKNNFSHQNRFPANGAFSQQRNSRNGSFGGYGAGHNQKFKNNSRPGSRNGPSQNRDGESPAASAHAGAGAEAKTHDAGVKTSAETQDEGNGETNSNKEAANLESVPDAGDGSDVAPRHAENLTETAEQESNETTALKHIETVDTFQDDGSDFDASNNYGMQGGMVNFAHGMGNQGYQPNNFGYRGGNSAAYGDSTVLTGEPRGLGVAGAPTGPRAMREGNNFARSNNSRFNPPPARSTPSHSVAPGSPQPRARSRSLGRDDTLRSKDRSPSRSRSPVKDQWRRDQADSKYPEDRERTPADNDVDQDRHRRHHRASKYDDRDTYDRESRGNRTRSASVDSKYRSSRRDKDKYRSSRSHRDRSREHRRRHRTRSPIAEDRYSDKDFAEDSSSRRKNRNDKDRHRDRSRDRDGSRDRDREREKRHRKDRDYDDDKYRSRDKDRDRRRRRDRDAEEDERDYDDKYRSSRRSRKDRDERDRDRGRDYDYEKETRSGTSTRGVSPPSNAPTGPSADNFSFRGASRSKASAAMPPPTGPRADRDRNSRKTSIDTMSTPVTPTVQDHYAAERERNARERVGLERPNSRDNKHSSNSNSRSLHSRTTSSSTPRSPAVSSKRPRVDDDEDFPNLKKKAAAVAPLPPTAPASHHRDKRSKSGGEGTGNGGELANLFTKGLRKKAGAPVRRGSVKIDGAEERERDRDRRR